MAGVLRFMEGPLVTWVKTFNHSGDPLDLQELCDGTFLNDVMLQIDQRDVELESEIKRVATDNNSRIQNWMLLLKNIKNYYMEVLREIIVMKLPDILAIVTDTTKDSSLREIERVLLLLLGCAVKCDQKEQHIDTIKTLDITVQEAMVGHIQQITEDFECVFPLDYDTGMVEMPGEVKTLCNITHCLVEERDGYAEKVLLLTQEKDYYRHLAENRRGSLAPPAHLEKYHLYNELTAAKNQLQKLSEELEDRSKGALDMRDELDKMNTAFNKMKLENIHLSKDAKSARAYRDELDVMKEQSMRAEKYEKELRKCKEKMNESDFFKARVDELRKDNDVLVESKVRLEDQLTSTQKRTETIMDELVQAQLSLEEVNRDREEMTNKMQELIDENAALEFERSTLSEGGGKMRRILSYPSAEFLHGSQILSGHPISEELGDSMNCTFTRLEMENDELKLDLDDTKLRLSEAQAQLEKIRKESEREAQRRMLELEHQAKELRLKTIKELSQEYQQEYDKKVAKIEKQNSELKEKVTFEFNRKVASVEKQKKMLAAELKETKKQVGLTREAWSKDREQCSRLENLNRALISEKEQFKQRLNEIQESSASKIKELEQEVETARSRSAEIQQRNDRISNLCDTEINKDNAKYLTRQMSNGHYPSGDRYGSQSRDGYSPQQVTVQRRSSRHGSRPTSATASPMMNDPVLRRSASVRLPPGHRPSTSSSMYGDPQRQHSTPVQGVVTPQRRPSTSSISSIASQSSVQSERNILRKERRPSARGTAEVRPVSMTESTPFVRHDKFRATMPGRITGYVAPERRRSSSRRGSESVDNPSNSIDKPEYNSDYKNRPGSKGSVERPTDKVSPRPTFTSSDMDSGRATSPESPASTGRQTEEPESPRSREHRLTSLEIISSETIRESFRCSTNRTKVNEKWGALVEKMVELQDKNQQLIVDNSDLKRVVNASGYSLDRLNDMEKRNLELELENRKLKKICETLQYALSGKNPYDPRIYHYFSNV